MFPCSAVQGMGSGLLFCTDCHNKYVMPILNGTFLCFKKCVHTKARILKSLKFYTIYTLQVYNLLIYVMMLLFYLYICNYVTYRGPQGRIAY